MQKTNLESWATEGSCETQQRKPMLLFVLFGSLLLRFATRMLFGLLFHEPPRHTRQFGNIPRDPKVTLFRLRIAVFGFRISHSQFRKGFACFSSPQSIKFQICNPRISLFRLVSYNRYLQSYSVRMRHSLGITYLLYHTSA